MEKILLHQFAEKLELLGYSRRCIADYPYAVERFFRYLTEHEQVTSVNQIIPQHITGYHAYLQFERKTQDRNLGPRTVAYYLEPIKTFYRIMHNEGLLQNDYSSHVIQPKRRTQLPRHVPSQEKMLELLNSVVGKDPLSIRDRCMLELLYATGIRSMELRTLTLDDYDATEATLFVHGKGSKDRIIPMGWWVKPYMEEYLHHARPKLVKKPIDIIFITKQGFPLTRAMVAHTIGKYCRKSGLVYVTPHTIRHACATHLMQNGADVRYVQELLGHEYLSSTQLYTRVDISFLKKVHQQYHPREQSNE